MQQLTTINQKPVLSVSLPEELEHLLNSKEIDWSGCLIGKSLRLSKKVPLLAKDSASYQSLDVAIARVAEDLVPANPKDVFPLLARLKLHFASVAMSEKEFSILIADYLSDLAPYPLDLIEHAATQYRQSPESIFFPKIGQLLQLILPV